ncbi:MAG: MBL fold metallo-hydrolase [Agromyces sp.]
MTADLEVVDSWFTSTPVGSRVTRIEEPHVHEFLRSNIWHVRGSIRDLVVDAGLGIGSLRTECPQLFERDPILVITHAHLDHMGSAHEFTERGAHPSEPVDNPVGDSLDGAMLAQQLGFDQALPELLITARPADFLPADYRLRPAPATRELNDGDVIDLGDLRFKVLHLPGHTPGSLCLFHESSGTLFSGDVVYDDELLDELHASNRAVYARSMRELRELPVRVVHPGHGPSFDGARLTEIIDEYLETVDPAVV